MAQSPLKVAYSVPERALDFDIYFVSCLCSFLAFAFILPFPKGRQASADSDFKPPFLRMLKVRSFSSADFFFAYSLSGRGRTESLVAPSADWSQHYLCFIPLTAIGPPSAKGSAIGWPYFASPHTHSCRSSQLRCSRPPRKLNRAIVVL